MHQGTFKSDFTGSVDGSNRFILFIIFYWPINDQSPPHIEISQLICRWTKSVLYSAQAQNKLVCLIVNFPFFFESRSDHHTCYMFYLKPVLQVKIRYQWTLRLLFFFFFLNCRAAGTAGQRGMCSPLPKYLNVPFFHFDNGKWWTVLLEGIFPKFNFSTGKSIKFGIKKAANLILSNLGCCNELKLQSPRGFASDPI